MVKGSRVTTGRTGGQRLAAGRGSWVAKNPILTRLFSETANRQRFIAALKLHGRQSVLI